LRGNNSRKIALALRRIDPNAPSGEGIVYFVNEKTKRGVPIMHLFREGRALGTSVLWVINFMNLLNLYFLANWLPTVVRGLGYSNSSAIRAGAMVQVG
jgi:AAHS family 4-hydroxybenzoate transporter-like MFS transporter